MRNDAKDWQPLALPSASSKELAARHLGREAAVVLRIAGRHSADEFKAALAAARRAFLYSLEEAGVDIEVGQALYDEFDVAGVISQYRA
jgi:hypothetical protein